MDKRKSLRRRGVIKPVSYNFGEPSDEDFSVPTDSDSSFVLDDTREKIQIENGRNKKNASKQQKRKSTQNQMSSFEGMKHKTEKKGSRNDKEYFSEKEKENISEKEIHNKKNNENIQKKRTSVNTIQNTTSRNSVKATSRAILASSNNKTVESTNILLYTDDNKKKQKKNTNNKQTDDKDSLDKDSLDKDSLNENENENKNKNKYENEEEDEDDEDYDIFTNKRNRNDRRKRLFNNIQSNTEKEFSWKKRRSSNNGSVTTDTEHENFNNGINQPDHLKEQERTPVTFTNYVKNMQKGVAERLDSLNLFEKLKKTPQRMQETIEYIYQIICDEVAETNKVTLATFFLNFLGQCCGSDPLTWTSDIVEYIDKQIYVLEQEETTKDSLQSSVGTSSTTTTTTTNNNNNNNININTDTTTAEKRINGTNELVLLQTNKKTTQKTMDMEQLVKHPFHFESACKFICEKLEQYISVHIEHDIIIKKKSENGKSYKAFCDFFEEFFYQFDGKYINYVLYICMWIFSLSVTKYRKIRFVSSLASLAIILGICKKIHYIINHEKQSKKQLLSEYIREERRRNADKDGHSYAQKKGGAFSRQENETVIEDLIKYKQKKRQRGKENNKMEEVLKRNLIICQLIDNILDDRKNIVLLNDLLYASYVILYELKIKDVFLDIRLITLDYYYKYLETYIAYFTNRKYTKHLLWILCDKDNKVKGAALRILLYMCKSYNTGDLKNIKIPEFIFMAKNKLRTLMFDANPDIRMKTFEVVFEMSKMQIKKKQLTDIKHNMKLAYIKERATGGFLSDSSISDYEDFSESDNSTEIEEEEEEEEGENTNEKNIGNKKRETANQTSSHINRKRKNTRDKISIVNVEECTDEKEVSVLSKKDKLIIGGLIWFNNNKQIAKIITELIYESEIKKKMKTMEKNKKGITQQQKKDALFDIVKHNIIFLTKYLYRKIPQVKNFVHYFDFLAKYSENMKLYTVIDKFVSGIREKLDALNHVDILITMLCEDTFNVEEIDKYQREIQKKKKRKSYKVALKKNNSLKPTFSHKAKEQHNENSQDDDDDDGDDNNSCSAEDEGDECINKNQVAQDFRKCLLYICESSFRNLHMDMIEMEEKKNNKNEVSGIVATEKNAQNMKPVIDVEKIKKMIHYTFYVIKNAKKLITMHHIHQEQLLLVYKILKTALLECRHIYQNGDKNNIYNFSATLIDYFKNDLDTSLNYFFNNIFPYLKETYEYLFFVINTMKLPYYATKYTMNIISLFLCLNESLPNTHKLSEEPLFELYYTYYNNLLDGFFCYRKRNNTEVELTENDGNLPKYLLNYRNNIIVINKNMAHVKKAEINTIESNIYINIMMLIHIHTLCFTHINAGLDMHNEKKNIQMEKRGHKLVKKNYFVFSEKEEYKTFFKNHTSVIELLQDHIGGSIYGHTADRNYLRDRNERGDQLSEDDVERGSYQQKNYDENDEDEEEHAESEDITDDEEDDEEDDDDDDNNGEEEEYEKRDKYSVVDKWSAFTNNGEFRKRKKKKHKKEKKKKRNKVFDKTIRAKRTPSNTGNIIMRGKIINIPKDKRKHTEHNLYYCTDAWVHSNVVLYICFYLLKVKVNSIKYYGRDSPLAPTSRLCLLCVDLIYILYENYVYHLCRKRDFFNVLYEYYVKSGFFEEEQLKADTNSLNKKTEKHQAHQQKQKEKDNNNNNNNNNNINNNNNNNNNTAGNDINGKDFEKLQGLNTNRKNAIKYIFIELNYIYENIITLRNDFNEIQIMLLRASNNTVLKYSVFFKFNEHGTT